MNKLDWRHYTIAVLLLTALTTWGARERTWSKRLDAETTASTKSTERVAQAEASVQRLQEEHKRAMAKATERTTRRTETRSPDGTVVIAEEEFERSLEQAWEEGRASLVAEHTAETQRSQEVIYALRSEIRQLETKTVRAAPRWAAAVGWDPLAPSETARWRAGLGLNLGPLTALATAAPAALATGTPIDTRPQLEAILRF